LGDQRAEEPEQSGLRRLAPDPVAQLAGARVGHPELEHLARGEHGTLVLGRQAGHRQHVGRCIHHGNAGVERARRRPRHLGQAGAGFDGLGDIGKRVKKSRICSTFFALLSGRHGGSLGRAFGS